MNAPHVRPRGTTLFKLNEKAANERIYHLVRGCVVVLCCIDVYLVYFQFKKVELFKREKYMDS